MLRTIDNLFSAIRIPCNIVREEKDACSSTCSVEYLLFVYSVDTPGGATTFTQNETIISVLMSTGAETALKDFDGETHR